MPRRPISFERAVLVMILLRCDLSDPEIARRVGVGRETVRRIRRGDIKINSQGLAIELRPGHFMAPRPMRCPGCKQLCEIFPCYLCGGCPSVGAIVAVAKANGLITGPAAPRNRRMPNRGQYRRRTAADRPRPDQGRLF
jgi:hypothetical protein